MRKLNWDVVNLVHFKRVCVLVTKYGCQSSANSRWVLLTRKTIRQRAQYVSTYLHRLNPWPQLNYSSEWWENVREQAEQMKGSGVSQGNHRRRCFCTTKTAVISLQPFRGGVGRDECRWKQCNENGSNNTAGRASWTIREKKPSHE